VYTMKDTWFAIVAIVAIAAIVLIVSLTINML